MDFLKKPIEAEDGKWFDKRVNEIMKEPLPATRAVESFDLYSGMARVVPSEASLTFSDKMLSTAELQARLLQEVLDCTKEISEKSAELDASVGEFATHLQALGDLNQQIECKNSAEIFRWLGTVIEGTGDFA